MKKILRHYVTDTFTLWVATQIADGIVLENGFRTLLLAGIGLMLTSVLARPVINLLLLPLNLVTFGLFSWVGNAVALYLVTLVVPGFSVTGFHSQALVNTWIEIPAIDFGPGVLAFIAFSFFLSVLAGLIKWVYSSN